MVIQVDAADVLGDGLMDIDTLVLPGGLVADYETSLGVYANFHRFVGFTPLFPVMFIVNSTN